MTKCNICNKRIWFWQKNQGKLTEPDEYGDRYGGYGVRIHMKCEEEKK